MCYRDKSSFCVGHFCKNLANNLNKCFFAQPALNIENFIKLFFNQFVHIILSTIDTHAPLKPLTRKEKNLKSKAWIRKGIFKSIKKTTHSNLILYKATKAIKHTLQNIRTC